MKALTKDQITAYEAKGFKRWTKGSMDRLYINVTKLGAEISYYKTGNVSSAKWQGDPVSNADGRRLLASKVYVDIATGELHVTTGFDEPYDTVSLEDAARAYIETIETTEDTDESGYETEAQRNRREFIESADEYAEKNANMVEATKEIVRIYADAQPDEVWTDGIKHRGVGAIQAACNWAQKNIDVAEIIAKHQQ